jgi:hypothetical protein
VENTKKIQNRRKEADKKNDAESKKIIAEIDRD